MRINWKISIFSDDGEKSPKRVERYLKIQINRFLYGLSFVH